MRFLDRLEAGSDGTASGMSSSPGTYAIPVAVRLAGVLDRTALEGALNDLVARHESLRTVFPESSGVPRQQVLAASAARLAIETTSVTEDSSSRARSKPLRAARSAVADPSLAIAMCP